MAKPSVDKSAKKLVSKSVKAAAKVAAINEKKLVSAAITVSVWRVVWQSVQQLVIL